MRTAAGVEKYHEPIGSPIVLHLPDLTGHSGSGEADLEKAAYEDLKKHYGAAIKALGYKHEHTKLVAKHVALKNPKLQKKASPVSVKKSEPKTPTLPSIQTAKQAAKQTADKTGQPHHVYYVGPGKYTVNTGEGSPYDANVVSKHLPEKAEADPFKGIPDDDNPGSTFGATTSDFEQAEVHAQDLANKTGKVHHVVYEGSSPVVKEGPHPKHTTLTVHPQTASKSVKPTGVPKSASSQTYDELKKAYGESIKTKGHKHADTKALASQVAKANLAQKASGGPKTKSVGRSTGTVGATAMNASDPRNHIKRVSLTDVEEEAVYGYTDGEYHHINGTLSGLEDSLLTPRQVAAARSQEKGTRILIDRLTSAINKSRTTEPITVYRYVTPEKAEHSSAFGPVGSRVGQTFEDRRFVSTTAVKGNLLHLFGDIEVEYHLPSGFPALDVNDGDLGHQLEQEVLLNRSQKFKVLSDALVDGKRKIVVEGVV